MKLTPELLRRLEVGESVVVAYRGDKPLRGQGDVSDILFRLKPLRFTQKRLLLVDPEAVTALRVVQITRTADAEKDS